MFDYDLATCDRDGYYEARAAEENNQMVVSLQFDRYQSRDEDYGIDSYEAEEAKFGSNVKILFRNVDEINEHVSANSKNNADQDCNYLHMTLLFILVYELLTRLI